MSAAAPTEPTEAMDTAEAATEGTTEFEATDATATAATTTAAAATTPTDKSLTTTTTTPPPPSAVEFEPPLACVRRILKNSLPSSTNVGKDASAAFARACGIFIIYLTACSNDFAREHKRQTITANDVLAAIKVRYVALRMYT
jgi:histone H3/H4